jgi:hypothetical protein
MALDGICMMSKSKIVLSAAVVLFTALEATADSLPRIDLDKVCRGRTQAIGQIGDRTVQQGFESCVKAEQEAQAALVAAWEKIPARYKTECIKPGAFSPSYGEWIACLELLIDIKDVRSKSKN